MNKFGTATPRQRWALYCITKKDYRETVLSKEEAADMIKNFGNPEYKKKQTSKTVEDELKDYLHNHWDEIMKAAMPSMDKKSVVETEYDGDVKRFAFIGVGCGITYITHRKGNKRAEAIKDAANKLHYTVAQNWFLNSFTDEQQRYYERIGCPLGAIWQQDMNMQQAYYYKVLDFAKSKGVNMGVKSYLD